MPDISSVYRPRKPQDSLYYRCVEDHFEEFEQVYDERFTTKYAFFRAYVKQGIYRYLDCGILHNGFARVKCKDCGHEYLLRIPVQTPALLPLLPSEAGGRIRGVAL